MNDLVKQSDELAQDVGETTAVSWTPPADMDFESYQRIGRTFQTIQKSLNWWLGDYLNFGEQKFGETYTQAVEATGRAVESLMKYKAVAERVPKEIRQETLGWVHHFYVAYIDADQRGDMLRMAANCGLSSRELKDAAKLPYNLRADLIAATEEGIDHDDTMRLINQFRLGAASLPDARPARQRDDEDDEDDDKGAGDDDLPFTDLEGDADGYDYTPEPDNPGLDYDTVLDYWNNQDTPMTFCGENQAIWEGISVRAGYDSRGKLVLIWEGLNADDE